MTSVSLPASAETLDVWFGTTTPKNGPSKGIYHGSFDTSSGKLSKIELAAETTGCGFLSLHPNGKTLYSTGAPDGSAAVTAYRVTGDSGKKTLEFMGSVETGDGGAAHLSTDRTGSVLFSAQYGGGSTTLYKLSANGGIQERISVHEHEELATPAGSGVVPRRQNAPHAHWCGTSPDNRFVFVPDLGMDKVVIFALDTHKPAMSHHGFGVAIPGGGPRHMKFSPNGKQIYLLNELTLSVSTLDYNAAKGTMTLSTTIPALSEETKAKETFNSASEIRVHPSGRFVYSANRGHDSITAYRVVDAGRLEVIEVEPIRGGWPRNFNIDPSGRWVVAAGRDSHTATVFSIDQDTGALTFQRITQSVPSPICVVFGS
ncbi:MAG: lactonase family protein [Planctomycetota bacterium]